MNTISTCAALFASTYLLVFFLGLQSLNVNGGHYLAAFITSLGIGISNLVLFKLAPGASGVELVAFLSGGPFGIISSMWAHKKIRLLVSALHSRPAKPPHSAA